MKIMRDGIVIVGFAGGGGSSQGIREALGRDPDVAINHDEAAVAMHKANHPGTEHFCQNIWKADPADVARGRRVSLAWFSPDCRHFSKAKGGKPVKKHIRDLAWVVVLYARRTRPDVIIVENVEEFKDWGPLTAEGMPCAERKGQTFEFWAKELRRLGYKMEHKELRACDYGDPTIRKRLFIVARCDGKPIVWPEPTHGAGRIPYRTAADIIDWSIPCPSIFLTKEEVKAQGLRIRRPLADSTLRRVALGVKRYVLDAADPFIVPITHQGSDRVHSIQEPLRTVTTAHRGEFALLAPTLVRTAHGDVDKNGKRRGKGSHPIDEPIGTITGSQDFALTSATLIQTGYGERPGQAPRVPGLDKPLGTVVAGGGKHALVTAAFMAQHNTGVVGHDARKPLSTITIRGTQQQLVTSHLINLKGSTRRDSPTSEPVPTITAGGLHVGEVRAFLLKYFGTDQAPELREPLHTVTTKDRHALVIVTIAGEDWILADIGMRMLTPRELFRANGMDDDFIIDVEVGGKRITKTEQIAKAGNMVCKNVAAALVAANCGGEQQEEEQVA